MPAFKKIYLQGGMDIYMTDPSITSSSSSARKCPRTRQAKFLQLWWAEFHQISLNMFEPIWLYKYYINYIICQNSVEVYWYDMLWDSVWFFLDVHLSSGYWGWAPARGSGWRRTWTPWCCISLSASFIRCFQPQEAQCLRCKITLIQPAKEGDTRWNKIYREMKRDTTPKWMDAPTLWVLLEQGNRKHPVGLS